jgi:hypothetical protein
MTAVSVSGPPLVMIVWHLVFLVACSLLSAYRAERSLISDVTDVVSDSDEENAGALIGVASGTKVPLKTQPIGQASQWGCNERRVLRRLHVCHRLDRLVLTGPMPPPGLPPVYLWISDKVFIVCPPWSQSVIHDPVRV